MNSENWCPAARAGANRAAGSEVRSNAENNKALAPLHGVATRMIRLPIDLPARFKTRYVEFSGVGADRLAAAMSEAMERAVAIDGARALECSKRAAAYHESGHCVVYALDGILPARAIIWSIRELGRRQWIGRTDGIPKWRVDDRTPAEADLKHARSQLAGVVAEALFDADYRLASSVDEIVTAQTIVRFAAAKLLCDAETLWWRTLASVAHRLHGHAHIVNEIAGELMRKESLKSRRLARLLQMVGVSDA